MVERSQSAGRLRARDAYARRRPRATATSELPIANWVGPGRSLAATQRGWRASLTLATMYGFSHDRAQSLIDALASRAQVTVRAELARELSCGWTSAHQASPLLPAEEPPGPPQITAGASDGETQVVLDALALASDPKLVLDLERWAALAAQGPFTAVWLAPEADADPSCLGLLTCACS